MAKNTRKVVKKKSLWAYTLLALIVLVMIGWGIWLVCSRLNFEKKISAFLKEHAMIAEEVKIDWFGNYVLRNIRIEEVEAGNSAIGEVRGHLSLFVNDFSLKIRDIRYGLAPVSIFIPELDIRKARMHPVPVAVQEQILPLARLLFAVDVEKVVMPELSVRQNIQDAEKETSYQDIELVNITDGKIGFLTGKSVVQSAASDKAATEGAGAPLVKLAAGPFEVHNINAALWAGFYFAGSQAGNMEPPYQQLHGHYSIKNIVFHALPDDDSVKYHIREVSGSGLSVKALYGRSGQDNKARSPVVEINSSSIEFLRAVGPLDMEIKGFTISNLAKADTCFDRGRFSYDGTTMDFVFDNFQVVKDGVKAKLASFALEKVRFPKFLEVASEISTWAVNRDAARNVDLFIRMTYAAIPRFAAVKMSGLTIDKEDQSGTDHNIMGLEKLNIMAEHKRGAMPTSLHVDVNKLRLPVTFFEGRGFDPETVQDSYLRTLGYSDYLDSNFVLDFKWDEEKQQIMLGELSSDIDDLGSFRLWGTIGNVNDTFFMDNPVAMAIAAAGFRIRDVHLSTGKDGLWQRVIIKRAEQTGKSLEEIRSERIIFVHEILTRVSSDDSEIIKSLEPVFDYLNAGGILTVDATAKNPNGVGIYEFIFDPADPYRWLDYFDLTANRQDADDKD